jgi:hypothetical protein
VARGWPGVGVRGIRPTRHPPISFHCATPTQVRLLLSPLDLLLRGSPLVPSPPRRRHCRISVAGNIGGGGGGVHDTPSVRLAPLQLSLNPSPIKKSLTLISSSSVVGSSSCTRPLSPAPGSGLAVTSLSGSPSPIGNL